MQMGLCSSVLSCSLTDCSRACLSLCLIVLQFYTCASYVAQCVSVCVGVRAYSCGASVFVCVRENEEEGKRKYIHLPMCLHLRVHVRAYVSVLVFDCMRVYVHFCALVLF